MELKNKPARQVQAVKEESAPLISIDKLVNLDLMIQEEKVRLKSLEKMREDLLNKLIEKKVTHEGDWSLVSKTQVRETPILEKVKKMYPDVFDRIAEVKISVVALRKALGEEKTSGVCTSKEYTQWETVYDPHSREQPEQAWRDTENL